jgi:phage protein D/phage baseplate assembly protein gpV
VTDPFYVPRFDVRISGLTMAADVADQVLSLTVDTDLDLAGTFSLVLRNPDNRLLDSPLLDLGKTVEIHLGYGRTLHPAFLGEIASIAPNFPSDGGPTVTVTGYDKSYKMRRNQPAPTQYKGLPEAAIAARIALENGLVPVVDPTPGIPAEKSQTVSDFAFLKELAEPYFFDVFVEWDRLHFQFPRPQTAAHVLVWGRNLTSFAPRISAAGLAGIQVIRDYNQELAQSIYAASVAMDFDVDGLVERLGSSALDLLGSLIREGIHRGRVDNPFSALQLAKALLQNILEGMYEGQGTCIGLPELSAGGFLEVRGVGKRFSGTYRVRKVTHRLDGNGFSTDFSITQRSHTSLLGMLRGPLTEEPPPDGKRTFTGVVVGVVKYNNELAAVPPQAPLGRVRVVFPGMSDDFVSAWAPCVRPMGGKGIGFYALPEEGEQVLVAFEDGDLNRPFVLGSLWNVQQPPPETNTDGTNSRRVIKTRSGHRIEFDDGDVTPEVRIEDSKGSSVVLDARTGAVSITAAGDLAITAKGDLTMAADKKLTLTAAHGKTAITMTETAVDVT